jgi:hypothetical protein
MKSAVRQHRDSSSEPAERHGIRGQIRSPSRLATFPVSACSPLSWPESPPRDAPGAFALLWLLVLTILNVQTAGALRSTLLFAIPVAIVAWTSWQHGFLFAAIAVIAARYGGAMPEPGSTSPLWLEGLLAFLKLSIDALVINAWGRRRRRRTTQRHETEDLPRRGG